VKLLVSCYFPFFDQHLAGGAQAGLRLLVDGWLDRGLEIRLLCPPAGDFPLTRRQGLEVRTGQDRNSLLAALEGVDQVLSVDRRFPLATRQPRILLSNAVCYPEERQAIRAPGWARVVVPSRFAAGEVRRLAPANDVRVIFNPLSPEMRRVEPAPALLDRIQGRPDRRYLLFPHRPEPEKGHALALDVIARLTRRDPRFHLLIPRAPISLDRDREPEAAFIAALQDRVRTAGLEEAVTFHDWIDQRDMPGYLSLGEVCLFLSTFPETFGLSAVQAAACGTPVLSLGAGALTEILPPGRCHRVVPPCADAIADLVSSAAWASDAEEVHRRFALPSVLAGWIDALDLAEATA
jgi:glycosyltransferase involved in cell wall biosynthesis